MLVYCGGKKKLSLQLSSPIYLFSVEKGGFMKAWEQDP